MMAPRRRSASGEVERGAGRHQHVHDDIGGAAGLDGADPEAGDGQGAEGRAHLGLHAGDDRRGGGAVEQREEAGERHADGHGEGEQDDEGDHGRVDVGGGAGVAGAGEPGGEEEAREHAAGDGGVDGPGVDVGLDQRARGGAAERDDHGDAGGGGDGGVEGGGAELHGAAAGGERDGGVHQREGGDAENEQALHGVDERLEEEVAEGVVGVVGEGDEAGDAQREGGGDREAEVEEAVEEDGAGAGDDRGGDADGGEERGGDRREEEGAALGAHGSAGDELGHLHDDLGLTHRGDVDEPALVGDGALAPGLGLGHGGEDLAGLGDLGLRGGEDLVGELHLGGVDRPLADHAHGGRAAGLGGEAVGVGEVAERAVDRQDAVGAAGGDDGGGDAVPGVAVDVRARRLVVLRGAACSSRPGCRRCRWSACPSRRRSRRRRGSSPAAAGEPAAISRTLAKPRAVSMMTSRPTRFVRPLAASIGGDQRVDGVEVGGGADLGDHEEVDALAGLLEDVDDVAVPERGVEAVDADGEGLGAPVDLVDRLDDVGAGGRLVGGRDAVLEVEVDHVGGGGGHLREELGARAGAEQLAAVRARRRARGDGEAHGAVLSEGHCCRGLAR